MSTNESVTTENKSSVEDRVRSLLIRNYCPEMTPEQVTTESSLYNDLLVDSLDLIELVMLLEEEFSINIEDGSMDVYEMTFGQLVEVVEMRDCVCR